MTTRCFAVLDGDGRPTALYYDQISPAPSDAIEISESDWHSAFAAPGRCRWIDGRLTVDPEPALSGGVPVSASKLGLKRALAQQGAWTAVKAAIAADPELQEDWDLATEIRRADPLTQAMIAKLGLTDAQVDALLIRAADLAV